MLRPLMDFLSRPRESREGVIRFTRSFWYQVVLAAGSHAGIVVAASVSRPFYLGRGPLGEQLHARRHADPMAARASWLQLPTEVALNSSQFLHDRESFAMDLLRTGRVSVT